MLNSSKLFIQVVLPYMKLSEKEREDMEGEPKEFVNYSLDICQKQLSRTYKSQAAKLLENLADNVDGLLSFAAELLTQFMTSVVTGEVTVQAYVADVLSKFGLHFTSDEELLDVCLICLSVLSYAVVKRGELMAALDSVVGPYLPRLLEHPSTLVKNRVCLFLSFYLDQLFLNLQDKEACVEKCMLFLFTSLRLGKDSRAVVLQALDALTSQLKDGLLKEKI